VLQRGGLGLVSIAVIVATCACILPTVADYRDVWDLVQ